MKFVDTHCHIYYDKYKDDLDQVVDRAIENNIEKIICVGVDLDSSVKSIEIVVWVALGGRGTLYGAVVGGILVNLAKSFFTVYFPEYWLFFLGALFVLVTIFLPRGVVGLAHDLIKYKKIGVVDDRYN